MRLCVVLGVVAVSLALLASPALGYDSYPRLDAAMSHFAGHPVQARCYSVSEQKHLKYLGHGYGGFTSVITKNGRQVMPGPYVMFQYGVCEQLMRTLLHPEQDGTTREWLVSIGAQFWLFGHELGRQRGRTGWSRNPGYWPECWGIQHDRAVMAYLGLPKAKIDQLMPFLYLAHRQFRLNYHLPGCR